MTRSSTKLSIPFRDGSVSAEIALPAPTMPHADTTVVLAPGAGSDMHHPFLSAIHHGLAALGHPAVKFNFPYKESGRRAPDPPRILEACYRAVVDAVRRELAPARLVIGGKSMGGRMASHLAAAGDPIDGLLLLGYPLHPAGKPDQRREAHLPAIRVPMLFVAGSRDPLCTLDLLRAALAPLTAAVSLHVIEGGDHSFDLPKAMRRERGEVWDEIIAVSADWLGGI